MTDREKKLLARYRSLGTVKQLEALVKKAQPAPIEISVPVNVGETVYYLKRDRTIVPCRVQNICKRFNNIKASVHHQSDYWEITLIPHDAPDSKYRLALSQYNKIYFSTLADAEIAKENHYPKILSANNLRKKEKL